MTLTTAMLVSAIALAAPPAGANAAKRGDVLEVKYCLVSMIDHVRLSVREAGALVAVNVREGTVISKGDVLGNVDDSDSVIKRKASYFDYQLEHAKAESDVNVRAAEKMAKVAEAEYQQAVDINRKSPGTVPDTEVRRLKLTWERGLLQIEVAELEMDVAKFTADVKGATVEAADNEIERRKLVSPIDGIVDHVMVHAGEWVQPGQPVMELVRVDRLRVEAFLNAYEVSPREVEGRRVMIEIPVGNGKTEQFQGHIEFVSSQVVADGAYRVWMEFDNRKDEHNQWVVRPGLTATMRIDLVTPPVVVPPPKLEAAPQADAAVSLEAAPIVKPSAAPVVE